MASRSVTKIVRSAGLLVGAPFLLVVGFWSYALLATAGLEQPERRLSAPDILQWVDDDHLMLTEAGDVVLRKSSDLDEVRTVYSAGSDKILLREGFCISPKKLELRVYKYEDSFSRKSQSLNGTIEVYLDERQNLTDSTFTNSFSLDADWRISSNPADCTSQLEGWSYREFSYRSHPVKQYDLGVGNSKAFRAPGSFEISSGGWPLEIVEFDPDGRSRAKYTVPIPPFVHEDQPESMRCFSCGCGCYRSADYTVGNDILFVSVHGIGFNRSDLGIYKIKLSKDWQKWKKVVAGPVYGNIKAAPDGCRLAVPTKSFVEVIDTCTE